MKIKELDSLSVKEELEVLQYHTIGQKSGLIRKMVDISRKDIEPPFFNALTVSSQIFMTEIFGWKNKFKGMGGSIDPDLNNARISAIGENIERYCSGFYDRKNFIKSDFKNLKTDATPPRDYALIHPEQNASIRPFTETTVIDWTAAYSLKDKKERYVPAAMVYVPFLYERPEEMIFQPVSTGLSAHPDKHFAILKSLNEVIERDAFTIFWYNAMPREEIDPTGVEEIERYIEKYFSDFRGSFKVLNVTNDLGIPSFFAFVRGEYGKGEPELAVGAASDIDPVKAYIKALTEAFHTRSWGINMIASTPPAYRKPLPESKWNEISDFDKHVELYCYPDYIDRIKFFTDTDKKLFKNTFSLDFYNKSTEERLDKTVEILAEKGMDSLVADVTTDDIRGLGLYVIRAIVPGLHPMNAEHKNRYLGGKRLYSVPVAMGYPEKKPSDMNPMPHPFP